MRILSLNGGGSLGYVVAVILEKIEDELRQPCKSIFDLIAGVSTGSIIGYGLAIGMPAKEIRKNYEDFIPKVFSNKTGMIMSFFRPYYKIEILKQIISDTYGCGNNIDCDTMFMTYATKVTGKYVQPIFWKSWRHEDNAIDDILTASCAAPLFFAPYKIGDDWFLDGGLSSNSPNMSAIVEAMKMNIKLNDIKLLNITPNGLTGYRNPKKDLVGLIKVAKQVTGISLFGSEMDKNYQTKKLLGNKFTYVNCDCGLPMDTTMLEDLKNFAYMYWYANKHEILRHLM